MNDNINKVLASSCLGYSTEEEDDENSEDIVENTPVCSPRKNITIENREMISTRTISSQLLCEKIGEALPFSSLTCNAYGESCAQVLPLSSPVTHESLINPVELLNGDQSFTMLSPPSLALSPLTILHDEPHNGEKSIEAPPFSPLTPKVIYNPVGQRNDERSIQCSEVVPLKPTLPVSSLALSSFITLQEEHQNGEKSIEAPPFSPLTPKQMFNPVGGRNIQESVKCLQAVSLPRAVSDFSDTATVEQITEIIPLSLTSNHDEKKTCISELSPLPLMSPETTKLYNVLEGYNIIDDDDDSVKDPDYVDEDETYCSDESESLSDKLKEMYDFNDNGRTSVRVNTEDIEPSCNLLEVEAEIHAIVPVNPNHPRLTNSPKLLSNIDLQRNRHEKEQDMEEILQIEEDNETRQNVEQVLETEVDGIEISKGRPKKGRKRKGSHTREENKQRKYSNLPYTTRKQKVIMSKEFLDYKCSCKKNCAELISKDIREQEFNKYVHLGSYSAQLLYITSCITENKKKRTYITQSEKRKPKEFIRTYTLAGVEVCRDMFIHTLQISPQKITISLKKMRSGDVLIDKRGKIQGGWNKSSEEDVKIAEDVIKMLPKYTSHYRRDKTDAMFLQPGMTIPRIYEIYEEKFKSLPNNSDRKCLKYSTFKEIFYKFNLRCKSLKKDTCNKCDAYAIAEKNGSLVDQKLKSDEHDKHLKIAHGLRAQMKKDFLRAKEESNVECLTFDLEKTLPLPRIPTNIVFYKRQLWVYNSGIHSASNDKGYCYVWVEGEAGRGAQEVGSCLLHYIDNKLTEDKEHLILWSDSCGGQNRNIKLTLMLKAALHSHVKLKTISIRFLEPGHTFLPNDTDFSKIETRLKGVQRLYTVEEYMDVMKHCKKQNPLQVVRMKSDLFLSCSDIEKYIVNRKMYVNKTKVNWLTTKEILLKKDHHYSIFMRSGFDEEFQELDIKKKTGKGVHVMKIYKRNLGLLWPHGKEIAQAKLDDIKSMMHLIPDDCKNFYKNLKGNKKVTDDVDGFGTLDFDMEDD